MPDHCSPRSKRNKARRGGLLVIVAGGLTALIGMGALVLDVGIALAQRTKMQMAADAAAMGAVRQVVKSASHSKLEAITVAKLNGYQIYDTDVAVEREAKRVTVAWKEETGLVLAPIFDILNVQVGVKSTAALVAIQDQLRVAPFIVPRDLIVLGSTMKIKYGPGESIHGNFGAVAIDGPGAKIYEKSIVDGAQAKITTGMFVDTETGNMAGPTEKGVSTLIQGDNTSYDDALTKPNRRLVVVPIVDNQDFLNMKGRSQPIMIRGFARFYLIGAEGGEITGRFIDTKFGNNAPPPQELRVKLVR